MKSFGSMSDTVQWIPSVGICVIFFAISGVNSNQVFDSCDWKKSGLVHSVESREIEKVHLSCESGSLEWKYPTTALHIQFQYPYSTADFTACFLPNADFSGATLIHQGAAPPYQVGGFDQPTGLNVIYSDPDVKSRMGEGSGKDLSEIACVNSTDGKLSMLLMGTFPRVEISRKIAAFKYELYPIVHHKHRPGKSHAKQLFKERRMVFGGNMEDCRPCTPKELLELYCTADFVARGHVLSVADDENYKWTNVEFLSDHVVRDTPADWPMFTPLSDVPRFNLSRIPPSLGPLSQKRLRRLQRGFFRVPAQCGFRPPRRSPEALAASRRTKSEDRGFVLMGNYNFDGGWLECFPKWNDMVALVQHELSRNTSPRLIEQGDVCDFGALTRTTNEDTS